MLVSGVSFGLLHALNAIATGDVFAALIQVIYTASIGMLDGAIYLRSRNLWGVILMHTLTDVKAMPPAWILYSVSSARCCLLPLPFI